MNDKELLEMGTGEISDAQIGIISKFLKDFILSAKDIRSAKIAPKPDPTILAELEKIGIPNKGRNYEDVANELVRDVFKTSSLLQHPKYLSFVTSAVSPYSIMGSILSSIYNINAGGSELSLGANLIEEKLVKWMAERAGYNPETCSGIFTSGGSISNLTGMIAGREDKLNENKDLPIACAFASDQAHSSIVKGMKMMGLRKDQIISIPSDENFRIKLDVLEEEIQKAIKEGKKPFLLIGTMGTTNTGTIDPLVEMGEIAKKYNMWFHVDGAYGGSLLISNIYRNLAKGLELSDSFSWDTHKWALQTYSCSTVIVKDKKKLVSAFNEHPEYLLDVINSEHVDGWDRGIEMSRPTRSIKLWFTLQALGTDRMADIIDYSFLKANVCKREIEKKDWWEITSEPNCGCITFRFAPKGVDENLYNNLTKRIAETISEEGSAYIVTTILRGKRVLRVSLVNGNTSVEDVIEVVDALNNVAERVLKELF